MPDHLICLLRNLYVGQEATVRTQYVTTDWFKIEKGVRQGCLLSPCLFNLYAENIMRNARLVFYEDLQDLLELTPKKDVLFIIGDWNAKVGSQETPGVTANLALEYRMKQGKG